MEEGRQTFLGSMAQIKQAMILGPDKNLYVEPVIWTWSMQRQKCKYPQVSKRLVMAPPLTISSPTMYDFPWALFPVTTRRVLGWAPRP